MKGEVVRRREDLKEEGKICKEIAAGTRAEKSTMFTAVERQRLLYVSQEITDECHR